VLADDTHQLTGSLTWLDAGDLGAAELEAPEHEGPSDGLRCAVEVSRPGPLVLVGRRRPRGHPQLRTWAASFAVMWVAVAAWSLASPMGSGPDEPAHLIRAASLVRGELLGTPLAHTGPTTKAYVTVEAPQVFARLENDVVCFRYKPPSVPASCQGTLDGSSGEVHVDIYVGRYSPLYYSLVGLPTLVAVNPTGMYLARLASGALSAAMLALAVVSLRRCRGAPLLGAGIALAMTPMVLYLAGVVNPSGLEISSAISAWVAVMALRSEPAGTVPASVVGALGISTIVLMLTRGLSPLWVGFIGLGLIALVGRQGRELLGRRCVQVWLAGSVAASGAALAWDLYADPFLIVPASPLPHGTGTSQLFVLALDRVELLVTSSIGDFGWLGTPSPFAVIVTWLAALGAVVLLSTCLARRRDAVVAVGTVVAWVVVPVVLIMLQARSDGIVGQGRDFMALGVGIPIVAAAVAGDRFVGRATTRRLSTIVIVALAVCQVADFYSTLRRYTVGITGPLNAFASTPDAWHPPVPGLVLLLVFSFAIAASVYILRRAAPAPAMGKLAGTQVQTPTVHAGG
jgi:hypothetical protein